MRITAAVTEEKGAPFVLYDLERDEPRANEAVVELAAGGICHTDLICRDHRLPVPFPAVFGHEGAGVVPRVGDAIGRIMTFYDFDQIEPAARDAEDGRAIKPVLRIARKGDAR